MTQSRWSSGSLRKVTTPLDLSGRLPGHPSHILDTNDRKLELAIKLDTFLSIQLPFSAELCVCACVCVQLAPAPLPGAGKHSSQQPAASSHGSA